MHVSACHMAAARVPAMVGASVATCEEGEGVKRGREWKVESPQVWLYSVKCGGTCTSWWYGVTYDAIFQIRYLPREIRARSGRDEREIRAS